MKLYKDGKILKVEDAEGITTKAYWKAFKKEAAEGGEVYEVNGVITTDPKFTDKVVDSITKYGMLKMQFLDFT